MNLPLSSPVLIRPVCKSELPAWREAHVPWDFLFLLPFIIIAPDSSYDAIFVLY